MVGHLVGWLSTDGRTLGSVGEHSFVDHHGHIVLHAYTKELNKIKLD